MMRQIQERLGLDAPGSIERAVKPVVERFAYTYDDLSAFFAEHDKVLQAFDEACKASIAKKREGDHDEVLIAARRRLSEHLLGLTIRYPNLGRVRGDQEYSPDRVEEVLLVPHSLTLYVGSKTRFVFVGGAGSRTFTVAVDELGVARLEVEDHQ